MSGEIEATPEMREQYARETAENLARLGLNPDRVEPWEDGYRTAKEKNAFEDVKAFRAARPELHAHVQAPRWRAPQVNRPVPRGRVLGVNRRV